MRQRMNGCPPPLALLQLPDHNILGIQFRWTYLFVQMGFDMTLEVGALCERPIAVLANKRFVSRVSADVRL